MRKVAALCSLLMVVPLVASAPRGDALYGLWEPVETSRGGLGAMAEFTPDAQPMRFVYRATETSLELRNLEDGRTLQFTRDRQ